MSHGSLDAAEARLADAARRFARRLVEPAPAARETEATLLRLGFALGEVGAVLRDRRSLPAVRLAAMRAALAQEMATLSRRARAGRFDYDLNRHIAVFRAARHLETPSAPPQSSAAGRRRPERAARSSATADRVAASMRP